MWRIIWMASDLDYGYHNQAPIWSKLKILITLTALHKLPVFNTIELCYNDHDYNEYMAITNKFINIFSPK